MSGVATVTIGYGLYQNDQNRRAARDAADTQSAAAAQANATQLGIYNQQRADNQPWHDAGTKALDQLSSGNVMVDMTKDPGYQFRMDQGTKALNASAAARGQANGGAQMMALSRYGQDYASGEYNNAYNRQFSRLSELAGFGQNANAADTAAGNQYSTNYGNNVMGAANAQSAGTIATANAQAGMLNNGVNTWMNYNMMNRMFPQSNNSQWKNPAQGNWAPSLTTGNGYLGNNNPNPGNYSTGNYRFNY